MFENWYATHIRPRDTPWVVQEAYTFCQFPQNTLQQISLAVLLVTRMVPSIDYVLFQSLSICHSRHADKDVICIAKVFIDFILQKQEYIQAIVKCHIFIKLIIFKYIAIQAIFILLTLCTECFPRDNRIICHHIEIMQVNYGKVPLLFAKFGKISEGKHWLKISEGKLKTVCTVQVFFIFL